MLMRKRAWDLMREDFTRVDESTSLTEVIRLVREAIQKEADNHICLVFDKAGQFQGVITMWGVLRHLENCVFTDEIMRDVADSNWDQAFGAACRACAEKGVLGLVETDFPEVRPNDPLAIVLEEFLGHRRGWAVVRESGRVLGVVLKADVFREISRDVLSSFA